MTLPNPSDARSGMPASLWRAYSIQAEAAARLHRRFAYLDDPIILASEAESARLLWAFQHPFGSDLLGCAETNS